MSAIQKYAKPKLNWKTTNIAGNLTHVIGDFTLLNGITRGVGEEGRLQEVVSIASIQIRGRLVPQTFLNSGARVTVWVIQDTHCNGSAFVLADFLEDISEPGRSFNRMDNVKRFRTLHRTDYKFAQNTAGDVGGTDNYKLIDLYIDLKKGIQTRYTGTDSTVGSISTNSIFCVVVADYVDETGALKINLLARARIRYYSN